MGILGLCGKPGGNANKNRNKYTIGIVVFQYIGLIEYIPIDSVVYEMPGKPTRAIGSIEYESIGLVGIVGRSDCK